MGTAGMVFSMARLSGSRPQIGSRGAFLVHDLDRLTLVADEPLPFQVDGDALESREKVTFRSVPAAMKVVAGPLQIS
jgi:diacylglycerol kinase family enzyme